MEKNKIRKVFIDPINIDLDEPFTIAIGTKYRLENVIMTVELENGIEGYDEAAPLEPINGENQATVISTLESCQDYIEGKGISEYRSISRTLKSVFHAQVTARSAPFILLQDWDALITQTLVIQDNSCDRFLLLKFRDILSGNFLSLYQPFKISRFKLAACNSLLNGREL